MLYSNALCSSWIFFSHSHLSPSTPSWYSPCWCVFLLLFVFQSTSSSSTVDVDAALAAKLQAEEDAALAQGLEDERLAMAQDVRTTDKYGRRHWEENNETAHARVYIQFILLLNRLFYSTTDVSFVSFPFIFLSHQPWRQAEADWDMAMKKHEATAGEKAAKELAARSDSDTQKD